MNRLARHFDTLLQLKAVIDLGSMNKAAKVIGASQPSLTRNIGQLEANLGVQLLNRTSKGVFPTVFGKALVEYVSAADHTLDQALGALNILRGATEGTIACGGSSQVMDFLVPAAVHDLKRSRPKVEVKLIEDYTTVLLASLRRGELDLVVAPQLVETDDTDLVTIELATDYAAIFARTGHRALAARSSLSELVEREHWVVPYSFSPLSAMLKDIFAQCGAAWPMHRIETSSLSAINWLVGHTDSLLITTMRVMTRLINVGEIAVVEGDWPFPTLRMVLYHRPTAAPSPLMTAFMTSLQRTAAQWEPMPK